MKRYQFVWWGFRMKWLWGPKQADGWTYRWRWDLGPLEIRRWS